MPRRKVSTTVYLTAEQFEGLRALHENTRVPVAEYVREGVDLVLARHGLVVPAERPDPGRGKPCRKVPLP